MGLRTFLASKLSPWLLRSEKARHILLRHLSKDGIILFREASDHGIIFYPDQFIGNNILLSGEYGRESVRDLRRFLEEKEIFSPNNVVLELGANIGTHSIYLVRDFAAARVVAVEPDPQTYEILDHNIALNVLNGIVTPVKLAMSDQQGQVQFARNMLNRGGSGIGRQLDILGADAPTLDVDATTVDDLLDRLNMSPEEIDLIWMDVESHELEVFRGMADFLSKAKPPIFFEYTPNGDKNRTNELSDLLFANYAEVYIYDKAFQKISPDEFDRLSEIADLLAINLPVGS